ncbi:hypothetical protein VB796_20010 [Arcicella sp. LKC2W]|uniref:hypothetical protein n=1 Tax=Arcicella sp. LKC2W TaxID=2984198 RepID=UPI002B204B0A|nr:hypothetical protein [Arcicella sp. LKC2W]MEA5461360.1 hypothetical protein [Arcicella sp. LKC2W]
MNKKELKEILNIYLREYLTKNGFKIDADISLVKKTKLYTYKIFLLINTYETVEVKSIFPTISFSLIENPLHEIYCFDKLDSEKKFLLKNSKTIKRELLSIQINLELHNDNHVIGLSEIIKEYMETTAIPFFEKYSDLQTINQEILANDMPYKEGVGYTGTMADFFKIPIIGGDTRCILRRMFIMKYCKDSRYEDFLKWYQYHLDVYEVNTHEPLRLRLYKIFNDTKEYLSKLEIS